MKKLQWSLLMGAVVAFAGLLGTTTAFAARGDDDGVQCESHDYSRARCNVPWHEARLVRQTSDTDCVRGRTWGFDRGAIWVDKGCAGVFADAAQRGGSRPHDEDRRSHDEGRNSRDEEWRPGAGWDQDIRFRCSSDDYHYRFCAVDIGRGGRVYIENQRSDSRCVEGRTWGSNRGGIWVNEGCAGDFVVERRWR